MPKHNFESLLGRIEYLEIQSDALANNVLGDPVNRQVAIYLPDQYDTSADEYPLLVDLVGFTGSGLAHTGWKSFSESVPQRIERLITEGKMGPVIVAFPDCFTSLGGNQYINSSVLGNWADFLTLEVLAAIESRYRVRPGREFRGLFGKSSGGYGAIIHGMLYADYWGAVACHSGDMAFDLAYRGDFPNTVMHLARHDGQVKNFLQHVESKQKISGEEMHTMMILAMAATYDPAPENPYGIRLPVDLETCELDEALWNRWLAWDPVRLIEKDEVQQSLASLKGLFIDCGSQDQYSLVFGARTLHRRLTALGIDCVYEEFADNHSGVDYRMDTSLPYLYQKLV
ncbi:MAG: alpha/beta hydrolase-fold protein [bacterium]|nr:enterochelin esterase [Gammaproteobacteria bacterium]HIL99101.1 enterochelin esterase [Pseudomonadales bacterium]